MRSRSPATSTFPAGTHFCLFYRDTDELMEILVPFFAEGLDKKESCVWVTSDSARGQAENALRKAVPDLDVYLEKGQIVIAPRVGKLPHGEAAGEESHQRNWEQALERTLAEGYTGLRIAGNMASATPGASGDLAAHEDGVNSVIDRYPLVTICAYPLDESGVSEVIDIVHYHHFAMIKREDRWERIEISARTDMLEALDNERAFTESALNATSDTFMVFDLEGRPLRWNRAATMVTGYSDGEMSRLSLIDFIAKEDRQKVIEAVLDVYEKGHGSTDAFLLTKDGRRIPYEYSGSLVRDRDGNPVGLCAVGRDLTERFEAQRTLREAEKRYRGLAESLPEVVFELDLEGRITYVNNNAFEQFGYTPEDLKRGVHATEVIAEVDHKRVEGAIYKMYAGRSTGAAREYLAKRKDGTTFPAMAYTTLVTDEDGKPSGIRGILTDITEQKEAQRELQKACEELENREALLRGISQAANDAILLVDSSGVIIQANPASERIFGYGPEVLVGQPMEMLIPEATREFYKKRFEEFASTGSTGRGNAPVELEGLKKDGSVFPAEMSVSTVEIQGERFVEAIIRDATERKRAEEALRESEERYRTLFESSRDALMTLSPPSWCFTSCNAEALRTFAVKDKSEFVSLGPWDLSPDFQPDGRQSHEKAREMIDTALRDGSHRFEWTHRRLNGEDFPAIVLLTRMEIGGQVILQASVRDITQSKRAEEALRESRETLQTIFDSMPGLAFFKDKENRLVRANRTLCGALGMSEGEVVGRPCSELFPNQSEQYWRDDLEVIESGRPKLGIVEPLETPRGTLWFQTDKVPYRNAEGEIVGVIGFSVDITERREAERNLVEAKERWEQTFRSVGEGMFIIDRDYTILQCNEAFADLIGGEPNEIIGRKCYEVVHGADGPPEACVTCASMENEFGCDAEVFEPHLDKYLSVAADPAFDPEGNLEFVVHVVRDITGRKAAEEALRESEQKYRAVVDNIGIGISLISPDMEILALNDQMKRWFPGIDVSSRPVCYRAFNNPPREDVCEYCPTCKTLEDGRIHESVTDTPTGGEIRHFRLISSPIVDEDGEVTAAVEMVEDITERLRVEQALRESEEKYRTLVENLNEGIWAIDRESKTTFVNDRMAEMLGYTVDEMIGASLFDFMDDCGRELAEHNLERRRQGISEQHDFEFVRKDGGRIYTTLETSPILDRDGNYAGAIAGILDITERRTAVEKVKRQSAVLSAINRVFYSTFSGDKETDIARTLLATAEELTGSRFGLVGEINEAGLFDTIAVSDPGWESCRMPKEDAVRQIRGMNMRGYLCRAMKEGASQIVNDPGADPDGMGVPEGHPPVTCFMGVPLKRGEETIGMMALANKDGGYTDADREVVEILAAAFVEVLTQKRTEEALRRSEADLKKYVTELARSNEELEQFAYVASHDLQEPLRMVASYMGLLEQRYTGRLDQDADDFIAYAVDGANRMQKMINDLLTFSRVTSRGGELEPTDPEEVLEETLTDLQVAIEESGARVTHSPLPTVMADSTQLHQVFQNLIGNAIKFRGERKPAIHVSASQDNGEWVFAVKDNGIGIEPEYANRIFAIFQRLHGRGQYPGTGIGLAVCKKIVERHGGRIWVESRPGQGSTFYFTMPVKEADRS